MKKILVTGATGFIGNYVVAELLKQGHSVIATSSNRNKARGSEWIGKVNYIEYDFTGFNPSLNYFDFFDRPEVMIHLYWEGLPNYKSLFHFEQNLPRHYAFLKNIISNGCKDVTVTGTCFEYGFREGALTEDLQTMPANPYGLAKDCLNKFLNEFRKTQPFYFKWIRLFYLYGKGQNPNSLFSQLDAAIADGASSFNMTGGQQVRDYLPVELASEYIAKVALQNKVTGIVNCSSGKGATVESMVKNYLQKKNKTITLNLGYYDYPDYEPMSFWGNDAKLKSILNAL